MKDKKSSRGNETRVVTGLYSKLQFEIIASGGLYLSKMLFLTG